MSDAFFSFFNKLSVIGLEHRKSDRLDFSFILENML